jgi:hypothetical protein
MYEIGQQDGQPFLAMEFLRRTLSLSVPHVQGTGQRSSQQYRHRRRRHQHNVREACHFVSEALAGCVLGELLGSHRPAGEDRISRDAGVRQHPHLDYGYAVTSHSSQGQTAHRVLINVDTEKSELLVNNRFAYVSVSRAQHDAQIYTNDRNKLSRSLSRKNSQRTATEVDQSLAPRIEPTCARTERPGEQEQGHSLGMGL